MLFDGTAGQTNKWSESADQSPVLRALEGYLVPGVPLVNAGCRY